MENAKLEHADKLRVELDDSHGVPVVRARGEIDLYNVATLEEKLQEALSKDNDALVVDLSKVAYLDSSGLSALISAYKNLDVRGGRLYVIAPPQSYAVRRVLEITRVHEFISVCDSIEAISSDPAKQSTSDQ